MMTMLIPTVFPTQPIEFHSAAGDISMSCFPPAGPARTPAGSVVLVQFEVDGEIEDDIDWLAVERAGTELPATDCIRCGLIETERQRFEHLHVRDVSSLVDDAFDDDDARDAGLAR